MKIVSIVELNTDMNTEIIVKLNTNEIYYNY